MNKFFLLVTFLLVGFTSFTQVCSVDIITNNDTTNCINNSVLLETTLGAGMTATNYNWFLNGATTPIPGQNGPTYTVNSNIAATNTYRVEVSATICSPNPATDTIVITWVDSFNSFQLTNISTINLCDQSYIDANQTTFDLTENEPEILNGNANNYTFTYFTDAGLTDQITNTTNFVNTAPTQIIYVLIQHDSIASCTATTSFEILDKAQAGEELTLNICDEDTDGFRLFNLQFLDNRVYDNQDITNFTITYHIDLNDASINANAFPRNINNAVLFTNTNAFQQDIYIRIENNTNPNCYDTTIAHLYVRPLPIINPVVNDIQCDDNTNDGIVNYNLDTLIGDITQETNVTFTYFNNRPDADANTNVISNIQTLNGTEQFFARITTIFNCYEIAELNVGVVPSLIPATFAMPDPLASNPLIDDEFIQCDDVDSNYNDDSNNNGINTFNIGASIIYIRDFFPSPDNLNLIIRFFESENEALLELNEIQDPYQYRNLVPVGQDMTLPVTQPIWVRVDNVLGDACMSLGQYITLTVNPLPEFEILNDDILCLGETNTISTNFDFVNTVDTDGDLVPDPHTISWKKEFLIDDSRDLGNAEFIDITSGGTYTATITNTVTNCERSQTVEVLESQIPTFRDIEVAILNNPKNQAIIEVTGNGDYEYSLDNTVFYPLVSNEDDRVFQDSNLFLNLFPGEYEVTVRDKNLCGEIKSSFIILDYKPYFSPNGDAFNENWTLNGLTLYPLSSLVIFDRQGKALAHLSAINPSWDGVYNGKIAKDSDYWFVFEYINSNGIKDIQRGHFSLITTN